ncbi:uncharacterized protein LOC142230688 [Haematobia irritans]|uniref:uncharacterized protein LOC142230688 n=1 Tax=Haematobia irritans TaxID=7368 RepID=UPI003F507239
MKGKSSVKSMVQVYRKERSSSPYSLRQRHKFRGGQRQAKRIEGRNVQRDRPKTNNRLRSRERYRVCVYSSSRTPLRRLVGSGRQVDEKFALQNSGKRKPNFRTVSYSLSRSRSHSKFKADSTNDRRPQRWKRVDTRSSTNRHVSKSHSRNKRDRFGYNQQWQQISNLKARFWKIFQRDYIVELQSRTKWSKPPRNLEVGALVLVHEVNTLPQKWLIGRVSAVVAGADGIVRVADIKTKNGIIRRAIHKLALIPMQS